MTDSVWGTRLVLQRDSEHKKVNVGIKHFLEDSTFYGKKEKHLKKSKRIHVKIN